MGIHRLSPAPFLAASLSKTARFCGFARTRVHEPDLDLRANQRADFGNHCLRMIGLEKKTTACRQIASISRTWLDAMIVLMAGQRLYTVVPVIRRLEAGGKRQ
jgi:hypothetical protein